MITALLAIALTEAGIIAVLCYETWREHRQDHQYARRLWQHIDVLEGDKRALTESLCRAQGKPYISPIPQERIPSDGWFDGRPEVKITTQ